EGHARHELEGDLQGAPESQEHASAGRDADVAGGARLHHRVQQRPDRAAIAAGSAKGLTPQRGQTLFFAKCETRFSARSGNLRLTASSALAPWRSTRIRPKGVDDRNGGNGDTIFGASVCFDEAD